MKEGRYRYMPRVRKVGSGGHDGKRKIRIQLEVTEEDWQRIRMCSLALFPRTSSGKSRVSSMVSRLVHFGMLWITEGINHDREAESCRAQIAKTEAREAGLRVFQLVRRGRAWDSDLPSWDGPDVRQPGRGDVPESGGGTLCDAPGCGHEGSASLPGAATDPS